MQRERRLQNFLQRRDPRRAGQLQKKFMKVFADRLIAREQPIVRINARGVRVVVTGAQVTVTAQSAVFAPHDHDEFGVCLVSDDAIHHVRSCLLQSSRKCNVGGFVEACHQLDDDRDFLASACRRD